MASTAMKILALAYDGMDFLDFGGPMEVLSHVKDASDKRLAEVTIASDKHQGGTSQSVIVTRDVSIDSILPNIGDFDIMIVPGGAGFLADKVPDQPGIRAAVKAFSQLPRRADGRYRGLVSICSGGFFLAEQGLLTGKKLTGHHLALGELQKLCDRHGGAKVVYQTYVDGGLLESNGINVITSAGISSGIDCSLYLIQKIWGFEAAERARGIMEYPWRREALPYGF